MKKNILFVALGLIISLQPIIWFVIYRKLYEFGKIAETGLVMSCLFSCVAVMVLLGIICAYLIDPKSISNTENEKQ